MTPDERAAIRARLDAATPGPWALGHDTDINGAWFAEILVPSQHLAALGYIDSSRADAEFIAHSRTDIELLLAEVERLTQMIRDIDEAAQPKTWKSDSWSVDGRTIHRILHPPREPAPRDPKPLDTGNWTPDRIWSDEIQPGQLGEMSVAAMTRKSETKRPEETP